MNYWIFFSNKSFLNATQERSNEMNELQIFNNVEFGEVRTIVMDNEPFFVGKDVTNILGYQNGSRDINRYVDEENKR